MFSGIEACTQAWRELGWEAVAFAEIEPYPCAVLQHHYPEVPNLGDVTLIDEKTLMGLGHIDLVVGGSPCQDLSIAGARAGLRTADGELTRSGLFDHQMRIFEIARRLNGARFMLWENVPGAASSNEGRDFAYILGSMVQREVGVPKGKWKNSGICTSADGSRIVEWRVLDAQYFGVAQRRRRVFALLDVGAWRGRQPILFEPGCLQWDTAKGKRARKGPSSSSGEGIVQDSGTVAWDHSMRFGSPRPGRSDTLTATMDKHPFCVGEPDADTYCVNLRGSFIGSPEPGVAETMVASQSKFPPVVGFDSHWDVPEYSEISLDSVNVATRSLAERLRILES